MELLTVLLLWLGMTAHEPDVSLDDLRAFPSPAVARHITTTTQALHRKLECQPPLCLSVEACAAQRAITRDAWKRWYVWDDLRLAHDTELTVEHRLTVLRRLREWLGTDAYYHGAMPPPTPFERIHHLP